ncbi:Hypothetical predicted protein [Paramuricea clavata]|uniref:Reverse transcriptase domain-containing protein n=1 Tax=Paramuricea clavata TaxID=317549 RepID=A0A7D9L9G0_PARCT|nr:Hypothetical predicted protein [Paramuricea clavata]
MTVTTPEACNYESLYVSQLLSTPNMTEYSHLHNHRRSHATSTCLSPVSPSKKLMRGLHIAMNFSISMILISLSNDIATNPGPTYNFSIPPPNVRGLKITRLNTGSILPKIDVLRLEMKDKPFDIFSASETWLKPDISDSEVALPGYSIIRMDRQNKVEIDVASVVKQLSTLKTNKSTGLDGISARLLKDAAATIAPTLTDIFNQSLKSSIFPKIWKDGKVTPIFKSGDRSNMSNYGPITVLPILSKIFERFVHTQIYSYLSENKILSESRFGFRPKLSTSTALAFFTDTILDNADNGLITASVFLDFSKAFDTVDHAILLCKLKSFGLDNNSLNWFESYLTNR